MKSFRILVLILTQVAVSAAMAISIDGKFDQNNGAVIRTWILTCEIEASEFCVQICGKTDSCEKPEPLCRNCIGTSSQFLRLLFTQLERIYIPSNEALSLVEVANYLRERSFIFVESESIYNFYGPLRAPELIAKMKMFCPAPNDNIRPLFVVELDEVSQPVGAKFALCRGESGTLGAYQINKRSGFSYHNNSSTKWRLN